MNDEYERYFQQEEHTPVQDDPVPAQEEMSPTPDTAAPEQEPAAPVQDAYTLAQDAYVYDVHETPAPEPPRQRKQKKGRKAAGIVALVLCCTVVSAAMGFGGGWVAQKLLTQEESSAGDDGASQVLVGVRQASTIEVTRVDTGTLLTAAEVYAQNVCSTVGITTSITTNYWGRQTTSAASGSGFIFTEDGYILTNYHVVEDSDSITVTTYDGESYAASLIGYDESNDIAVLKISAEGLTPVVLGDSDSLNVGDSVLAIGNPLGELTFSLTAGVVSALNREVTFSSGITMALIQTDCAINAGNSGGALFNMYGEVIGITNAKYSSSGSSSEASIDNIGFAIPINDVYDIVVSIIEKGYISKPYIGITVADVSSESQSYGLPQGAAVRSVTQDSPAQEAGLKTGDIITEVNGTAISGSTALVNLVGEAEIGEELTLTVYRQGLTLTLKVTVGEQIQSALANEQTGSISSWG